MLGSTMLALGVRSPTLRMQLEPTVTITGVPGTPGGHDFARTLPGVTAPFGFFDPLNLIDDCAKEEILRFREAELTHGRVAMVGALGCLVQERFHPMFDFDAPATFQLDAVLRTPGGQSGSFVLLVAVLFSEMYRARTGWMEPDVESFRLREDYSPGDLGFDPLGMKPKDAAGLLAMQNKELNNGRLAMLAVAGIIGQELVTKSAVW